MTFQNTNPWVTGPPWFYCSQNCFFVGSFWIPCGEHRRGREPLLNISVPRYSTRQAGPSRRGRFPWAKPMLCLQNDISSLPALFSCSPCFVLATLSCSHWSKGCSCPLGIRTLWLCPQNLSFSVSVYSPVCADSGQSRGGRF